MESHPSSGRLLPRRRLSACRLSPSPRPDLRIRISDHRYPLTNENQAGRKNRRNGTGLAAFWENQAQSGHGGTARQQLASLLLLSYQLQPRQGKRPALEQPGAAGFSTNPVLQKRVICVHIYFRAPLPSLSLHINFKFFSGSVSKWLCFIIFARCC